VKHIKRISALPKLADAYGDWLNNLWRDFLIFVYDKSNEK
jgi:hypothetical protein